MKEIALWNITFMVDGKLYTTNADFDHSFFCSCITMKDLVLIGEEE